MKLRFIDSNNNLKTMILDETLKQYKKKIDKEGVFFFGNDFLTKQDEFLDTIPNDRIEHILEKLNERNKEQHEAKSDSRKDALYASIDLMLKYYRWLDKIVKDEDRQYTTEFTWDINLGCNYNEAPKTRKTKSIGKIYTVLTNNGLDAGEAGGQDFEQDPKKPSVYTGYVAGRKSDYRKAAQDLADIWNTSAQMPKSGKSGEITSESIEKYYKEKRLPEIEKYLKLIEESLKAKQKAKINENGEIVVSTSPASSLTKEEITKLTNKKEELEKEKAEIQNTPSTKLKNLYFEEEEFEPYTADDVLNTCFSNWEKISFERPERLQGMYIDSKENLIHKFGDCFVKFNFEKSVVVKDGKSCNYFDLERELKKQHRVSDTKVSYEEWMKLNPQIVSQTLNTLCKGDNAKMNDSLKNLKFKFKDGVEIEVLDSEGKDFNDVKSEVLKVHREFLDHQLKDKDIASENEEETKEVLEEYGAKAQNDSLMGIALTTYTTKAQEAILNNVPKEEFIEKEWKECPNCEKDFFEKVWDVAEQQLKETESDQEVVEDSIEQEKDAYKVIVNGKEIGVYETYEEAEEAEKKALENIEKGIPKVNLEDDAEERAYEDEKMQCAYENACECLYYGVSKADWDSCGLSTELANDVWKKAFKDMAEKM